MHEDTGIIATICGEIPAGDLDGTGSGFGLSSCSSCGRFIDGSCSVCPPPAADPLTAEEALRHREELRAQHRREAGWYDRGGRHAL